MSVSPWASDGQWAGRGVAKAPIHLVAAIGLIVAGGAQGQQPAQRDRPADTSIWDSLLPPTPRPPPPMAPPQPINQHVIHFEADSQAISEAESYVIARIAERLGEAPVTVEVVGHSDATGSRSMRWTVALRRAEAVAAALARGGVPRSNITVRSVGDTQPRVAAAEGVPEPGNRRVDILLR